MWINIDEKVFKRNYNCNYRNRISLLVPANTHIILLLVITLIVGIIGVAISDKKIKFLFPIFATIMVVPTMFMYYEPRVYGNIFWMFVFSALAVIIGEVLRLVVLGIIKLVKKIRG